MPEAATGDITDLQDRLLDIHEAAMEAVEARAQQEDDADDVKHRKNRLKKKYFDDAFDKLPDHAKELMLEVGKRGEAQGSKTRIINTMFEKDGRAK